METVCQLDWFVSSWTSQIISLPLAIEHCTMNMILSSGSGKQKLFKWIKPERQRENVKEATDPPWYSVLTTRQQNSLTRCSNTVLRTATEDSDRNHTLSYDYETGGVTTICRLTRRLEWRLNENYNQPMILTYFFLLVGHGWFRLHVVFAQNDHCNYTRCLLSKLAILSHRIFGLFVCMQPGY